MAALSSRVDRCDRHLRRAVPPGDACGAFRRRVLPGGRRPLDAGPPRRRQPRHVFVHGVGPSLAGRGVGLRPADRLAGGACRRCQLLVGLRRGVLWSAPAERRPLETHRLGLAVDGRALCTCRGGHVRLCQPAAPGPELHVFCRIAIGADSGPPAHGLARCRPTPVAGVGQPPRQLPAGSGDPGPSSSCCRCSPRSPVGWPAPGCRQRPWRRPSWPACWPPW